MKFDCLIWCMISVKKQIRNGDTTIYTLYLELKFQTFIFLNTSNIYCIITLVSTKQILILNELFGNLIIK